jgi:hypothetical protein
MEFLIAIACGVAGIALLGSVLLVPLRLRFVRELRVLPDSDLERRAFRFEETYFQSIGVDHPDVLTFKHLIETADLSELRSNWGRLSRAFMRLERRAGHRGRPLIMEYYNWYELVLAELARRRRLKERDSGNAS